MAKNKERDTSRSFGYSDANSDYNFQMRKKRNWWWLLLLLLVPLLFILGKLAWRITVDRGVEFVDYQESPCGSVAESGGEEGVVKPVNMGQTSGAFLFEYNTYSAWDRITIYNGMKPQGRPIFRYVGGTGETVLKKVKFNSSDGYISVVVKGIQSGTAWEFTVYCPE